MSGEKEGRSRRRGQLSCKVLTVRRRCERENTEYREQIPLISVNHGQHKRFWVLSLQDADLSLTSVVTFPVPRARTHLG
ncbi:Hypothetical predicted protein [Scomber scombrus]|uniref:Uncharacterized protein n=1 Tax=Scomber scombrus TaxID=13677 RepID=A0AAV1PRY8_SCOSC